MAKIKLCKGNIKLGKMFTWSKLYGDHDIYVKSMEMSVHGTCGKHCAGCEHACYVKKSYRYGSVILNHARNTLAIRNDMQAVYNAINSQLNNMRLHRDWDIRLHQSGELESAGEFLMWGRVAKNHPEHIFYIYTKAFECVERALLAGIVPANMIVLYSIWGPYGLAEYNRVKHLDNVKAFVYVDDVYTADWYAAHGLILQTTCRAYDENGKLDHDITCDKCHKCNRVNRWKVIACYAH